MYVCHETENEGKLHNFERKSLLRRLNREINPTFVDELGIKTDDQLLILPSIATPCFFNFIKLYDFNSSSSSNPRLFQMRLKNLILLYIVH